VIHVLIDTSILRSSPNLQSEAFKALRFLKHTGKIQVHIPYFVQQEFISSQKLAFQDGAVDIRKTLKGIERLPMTKSKQREIDTKAADLQRALDEAKDGVSIRFGKLVAKMRGKIHEVQPSHGARVAADYFSGAAPFQVAKSRKDIPDSFIWQVVKDVSQEVRNLHVVTADKLMLEACDTLPNVTGYAKLDEFIDSDSCRPLLTKAKLTEQIAGLGATRGVLEDWVSREIVDPLGKTLTDRKIPLSRTRAYCDEGWVVSLGDIVHADVKTEGVVHYGNGMFTLPFSLDILADVWFYMHFDDVLLFKSLDSDSINIIDFTDDYSQVSVTADVRVVGTASLRADLERIQQSESGDNLREVLMSAQLDIDSIDEVKVVGAFD
jgi:hypothetical protein